MRYRYWKKIDKFTWEHKVSKDKIEICHKVMDTDLGYYQLDYWFSDSNYLDYVNLDLDKNFQKIYKRAVIFMRDNDTINKTFKKGK